jgi:type IV secretion system protein VirB4
VWLPTSLSAEELSPVTPNNRSWFDDAGRSDELVRITRFVSDTVFATGEGGYGSTIRLTGISPECLSDQVLNDKSASMLRVQRLLGEEVSLFQTLIKKANPTLHLSRFAEDSDNEYVRATESARNEFLLHRKFYECSLYWTLYVHPPKMLKTKDRNQAFKRESARMLGELKVCLANVVAELIELGPVIQDRRGVIEFFSYLCNLKDSASAPKLTGVLDVDLFQSSASWHRHGLVFNEKTIYERFAQPFSVLKIPAKPRAAMLAGLLAAPAEFVVTIESRRRSADATRAEVSAHQKFLGFFKHNPLTLYFHRNKPLPKTAESNAADAALGIGGFGGIIQDISQFGRTYCTASVLGLVHATTEDGVRDGMAAIHRVFGESETTLTPEGYGALTAYQAMFPGAVQKKGPLKNLNLWRRWIREDYLADMSLWFCPERGSTRSATLEDECLSVFETRCGTPYYFDPFDSGARGAIVCGEKRRGKTFWVSFYADHEAKYGGYIFIYDIGGAYESVVLQHGGKAIKVGIHGPRFNPFSLENTEGNRNDTAQLVMLLLKHGGAEIGPSDESDIRRSVAAIYELEDPSLRRLRWLCLSPRLQPYLAKWIENGVYGRVFDNPTDEIKLSRIISFDFEGLSPEDSGALMEPLLFWIRLRVNDLIRSAGNLASPKLEVYDEVWRLIQDKSVVLGIFDTMKTADKKLGGIILATQDPYDFGPHAQVIRNACPDFVSVGGAFDRKQYEVLFGMNDNMMNRIDSLRRGEFLLYRRNHSLIGRLAVDERSKWLYSTHPQDVRLRNEAIAKHGLDEGIKMLALTASAK